MPMPVAAVKFSNGTVPPWLVVATWLRSTRVTEVVTGGGVHIGLKFRWKSGSEVLLGTMPRKKAIMEANPVCRCPDEPPGCCGMIVWPWQVVESGCCHSEL